MRERSTVPIPGVPTQHALRPYRMTMREIEARRTLEEIERQRDARRSGSEADPDAGTGT